MKIENGNDGKETSGNSEIKINFMNYILFSTNYQSKIITSKAKGQILVFFFH